MNNYSDDFRKTLAVEISTQIDVQTQQKKSELMGICDRQVFTAEDDKIWDVGGLEFKNADGVRTQLKDLESELKEDNRTFRKTRKAIVCPIDLRRLSQSELREQYMNAITRSITDDYGRKIDETIYGAMDATFYESTRSNLASVSAIPRNYTFLGDGNANIDFTNAATYQDGFNYKQFLLMLQKFEAKFFNNGIAFLCSEVERAKLREDISINDDYKRSSGVQYDNSGRITYLNGVRIIALGSQPRVGKAIVKKSKNDVENADKRACFMFNTNEGGGISAITYDLTGLNLEVQKVQNELKVNQVVADFEVGAIRKASGFIIRAYTEVLTN
jgi:hypothetical protein